MTERVRARDLGIEIGYLRPGTWNAITDVPGVRVGFSTIIEGEGDLVVGQGPVRTGVTAVFPRDGVCENPVFAGYHQLNGNGEMTGIAWIQESGLLTSPIGITNTHSVGWYVMRSSSGTASSMQDPGSCPGACRSFRRRRITI
ncbi:MAG: P1 family peptidase [Thermomicrobiales bacterium]